MKKALLAITFVALLSGCDFIYIEDIYDPRDQFTGRFDTEEYSETLDVMTYFDVHIVKDADPYSNVVYIRNFYGANIEVFAEVSGNKLVVPRQRIGYYLIEGIGSIDFGEIVMSYTVEDTDPRSRFVDYCSSVSFRR
jgi:hypothetical protein